MKLPLISVVKETLSEGDQVFAKVIAELQFWNFKLASNFFQVCTMDYYLQSEILRPELKCYCYYSLYQNYTVFLSKSQEVHLHSTSNFFWANHMLTKNLNFLKIFFENATVSTKLTNKEIFTKLEISKWLTWKKTNV